MQQTFMNRACSCLSLSPAGGKSKNCASFSFSCLCVCVWWEGQFTSYSKLFYTSASEIQLGVVLRKLANSLFGVGSRNPADFLLPILWAF